MLFTPKFEEVVAKPLIWKNKLRKLFVNLKEHDNQGTWISESNNPFRRHSYFLPEEIEGE